MEKIQLKKGDVVILTADIYRGFGFRRLVGRKNEKMTYIESTWCTDVFEHEDGHCVHVFKEARESGTYYREKDYPYGRSLWGRIRLWFDKV